MPCKPKTQHQIITLIRDQLRKTAKAWNGTDVQKCHWETWVLGRVCEGNREVLENAFRALERESPKAR